MKTLQYGNAQLASTPHRIPWHWTYALFLDKRWDQIQEISSMYGDEEMPEGNYYHEIPKQYWHDHDYVDKWIEDAKKRRNDKMKQ